jgi:membrane associated rhomboid family serine protease
MSGASRDGAPGPGLPQFVWPRPSWAVKRLLIGLTAVFVATFALYLLAQPETFERVSRVLRLDPASWWNAFPLVPVWQLATYGLLHSPVDLFHVLGNLLLLYFFGTMLEDELGARRFLILYASAQFAGAAVHLAAVWAGMPGAPVIGASGACLGLMVAVATMQPRRVVYLLFLPIQLRWLALLILVLNVFNALVQAKNGGVGGTAYLVHLGGIAWGFLAVRTGLALKDPFAVVARKRAVAEVERAGRDAERLDQLLEKIAREGIGSLTRGEREFLKRASSRK